MTLVGLGKVTIKSDQVNTETINEAGLNQVTLNFLAVRNKNRINITNRILHPNRDNIWKLPWGKFQ